MSGPISRHQLEASRERLVQEINGRRWLSEPSVRVNDFVIEDFAGLSSEAGSFVLAVLRFHRSGRRYFVPLRASATGELREASYDAGLVAALVRCMHEGRTLATEQQRSIRCRAQPSMPLPQGMNPAAPWAVPFQEGMSSNCLSEVRHGDGRWVYKLYKRMNPDSGNELRAMELLAGSGLSTELLGSITYHDGASTLALGAMTSWVEGEPLYLPLSRHIKAVCAQVVSAPAEVGALTRRALAELEPLSRRLGEQMLLFHHRLNQSLSPTGGRRHFLLSSYLDSHRERWERVHVAATRDGAVQDALRARVVRQLERMAQQVLAPERLRDIPPLPATIAHCDLHLSHILVAPAASGGDRLSILDVSPRSLDEQAPAFLTQTALQDMLSLFRALQYFSFDEILDAIKDVIGTTQLEATRIVLEEPERLPPACTALLQLLADWSRGLFGSIERAYLRASQRDSVLDTHPTYARLFYACRLLQEMEYNYSYSRDFFKYCDFYYLLQMEGLE